MKIRIKSPTVGTLHWLVCIGKLVKKGQMIGRINALKLDIEILAPVNGKITDFIVEDNMPIGYGQIFVIIEVIKK